MRTHPSDSRSSAGNISVSLQSSAPFCRGSCLKTRDYLCQRVTAVFFPCQAPGRAQRIEREHHFASVAAGKRRHQLLEPLRAVGKGRFDGREALALKTRRLRDGRFDSARLSHRQSQIETRFRPGPRTRERGVERQRAESRLHDEVAVGLEARRERPVHLLVRKNVDVRIDDEHVLDVGEAAEGRGNGVPRLARHALSHRDAQRVHASARGRRIHRHDLAHGRLERAPDHHLGAKGVQLRGVGAAETAAADGRGLEERVPAPRNRGEMEHRVLLHRAVVAEELAVGAFGLDVPASSRWPSSTHSASAGTRMSQLTHFTTASGASRRLATRPSSSTGRRITAATKSAGWAPTTKATGSRSPRSTAASYKARRSEGELMSIPASLRPRSIRRRTPTLVQPFEGSTTKSIEAEMYGAPSKPCWRLTGSVVRSALSPVSTTSCAGAASRGTSTTCGAVRRRRSTSASSLSGVAPKARARRARPPMTLPASCAPSLPTRSKSTALALPSSARATSASSAVPACTSSSPVCRNSSTNRRSLNRSRSIPVSRALAFTAPTPPCQINGVSYHPGARGNRVAPALREVYTIFTKSTGPVPARPHIQTKEASWQASNSQSTARR